MTRGELCALIFGYGVGFAIAMFFSPKVEITEAQRMQIISGVLTVACLAPFFRR